METKKPETKEAPRDRKMMTFFLVIWPSLLLAIDYGSIIRNVAIKAMLLLLQIVIVKNLLDDYYSYRQ